MTDYPPNMTLRPLGAWPGTPTWDRRRAPFRSKFAATLTLLRQELHALGDGGPRSWYQRDAYPPSILQIGVRERDLRIDGMPRADAKVTEPGIILSIEPASQPPMSFPCDTFVDWQDNVRAVALTLEALRKIDRYGVTQTGQQYRGWQAIEARSSTGFSDADAAEKFLRGLYWDEGHGLDLASSVPQVYRRVRAQAHPDRNGGDRTQWDRVEAAAEVLRAAGRLA